MTHPASETEYTSRGAEGESAVDTDIKRTLEVPLHPATYEYGKAFEHFLVTQIVHLARYHYHYHYHYHYPDWRHSYLQTGAGAEIDLVIERPGLPVALIEIKSEEQVDERDVRTLDRFTGDFGDPLACASVTTRRACGSNASCACTGARRLRNWRSRDRGRRKRAAGSARFGRDKICTAFMPNSVLSTYVASSSGSPYPPRAPVGDASDRIQYALVALDADTPATMVRMQADRPLDVVSEPEISGGIPVFRGTRVPVRVPDEDAEL